MIVFRYYNKISHNTTLYIVYDCVPILHYLFYMIVSRYCNVYFMYDSVPDPQGLL